jgi:hypothetical protein
VVGLSRKRFKEVLSVLFRLIVFCVIFAVVFAACLMLLPVGNLWSLVIAPIVAWILLPKRKEQASEASLEQKRIMPVLTRRGADNVDSSTQEEINEPKPARGVRGKVLSYGFLGLILIFSWYAWGEYQESLKTPEAIAAKEAKMAERAAEKKLREEERKREAENALINKCKDIPYADATGQCNTLEGAKEIQAALKSLKAVDPLMHCRQETKNRSKYPAKVDVSLLGSSELVQYYDGSLVSIVNLRGETMNGFGLMVPFVSTCKIRKKLKSDESPVFYEFLIR